MTEADATRAWALPARYDFFETTRMLRTGGRDPTVRRAPNGLWRTTRTARGPATVRLIVEDDVHAQAWGPGAEAVLDQIPDWLGLNEPPWVLPPHPVTDRLLREHPGLRSTNTCDPFDALMVAVLQQLVTWNEAAMNWRRLCQGLGERAPGPVEMRLPPTPAAIRRAGVSRLRSLGVGQKRGRTLVELARVAHALDRITALPTAEAQRRLHSIRGIGPWTTAMALGMRLGRPEPVPVGDYHMPDTVAFALAGEPRGTEARMLELLAPFDGFVYRVIRLIFAARIDAPRRGPRQPWRRHG